MSQHIVTAGEFFGAKGIIGGVCDSDGPTAQYQGRMVPRYSVNDDNHLYTPSASQPRQRQEQAPRPDTSAQQKQAA